MTLKDYLKKAQKEKWAIGQFNTSNLETLRAIIQAALKLKSPIIIGTSESESKFFGSSQIASLVKDWKRKTKLPIFLNLDHGRSLDYIKEVIEKGYTAVHFDGSKFSLEKNIDLTKKVIKQGRSRGVLVEGEVGFIPSANHLVGKMPKTKKEDLTNPKEALMFIKKTGVDSLAINIGTFHGMRASGKNPHINLQRLKEIKNRVGGKVFLVLHGGSGTPKEDIKAAIKLGIVKININTELRLVYKKTLKKALRESQKELKPYKYLPKVVEAIQKVVEEKIMLFGSDNKID